MKGLVKGPPTIKNKQSEQNPQLSLSQEWVRNQPKGLERDIGPPSDPRPHPGVKAARGGCARRPQRAHQQVPALSRAAGRAREAALCLGPAEPRILSAAVMVAAD